ncbi:MAG: radical SAM family heme chaperone HemW [Chitinophagales bacterium]
MAGIYIHIPFCKQACNYCNFYFSTSNFFQEDFLKAVIKEIELQKDYLLNQKISSVYFGGGTPSILPSEYLNEILNKINSHFSVENNAEITLEANPDDLTLDKLKELKQIGINRLSIGIQSFFDEDLKLMNRAHTAKEATNCLKNAEDVGFKNLSVDLIYGIPNQNSSNWQQNLQQIKRFNINHLSCYALTVEEKTPLYFLIRKGKIKNISDKQSLNDFTYLQNWATENNWQHYEISNLSKNNNFSLHNTSYWQNKNYLGLGPAAHSYNGRTRQWNIANIKKYIDALKNNTILFEKEELSEKEKYNEYIMTSLRIQWGVNLNELKAKFSDFELSFNENLAKINPEWLNIEEDKISISKKGMFYTDGIAAEFFEV